MKSTTIRVLFLGVALSGFSAMASTPDGLLTAKTKLTLWTSAGIRSTSVHVDTNDGVVTLYGKVPTAEQRALAERTAREVKGVRSVTSLLQVVSEADEKRVTKSDNEIMALTEQRLKTETALNDSAITVKSVDKGVVLLTGTARTLSDHLRAIVVVDRLPGVRRVASEIKGPDGFGGNERVMFMAPREAAAANSKPGEARSSASDMRISVAVKLRLLTASNVPSTEISVDTDEGVVTLFGLVPTADVKRVSAVEAGKVAGVVRVSNDLEVVPTSQKREVEANDADITRDLGLAFKGRAEFRRVDSAVKNGIVRLTGGVSSGWDQVSAVRAARQIAGVRGIENDLKVEEP